MTTKPEISLKYTNDNPWYDFMKETFIIDDKYGKDRGYHWFCSFKNLLGADLEQIQETLPEQHPLKHENLSDFVMVPKLELAVSLLKNGLKHISDINEINFATLGFKKANFYSIVFPIKVSFRDVTFHEDADFNKALFFGSADIPAIRVGRTSADTSKSANFGGAEFNKDAIFTNTIFHENVDFTRAIFHGEANFKDATFHTLTTFYDVVFNSLTYFTNVTFLDTTNFSETKFLSNLYFTKATFVHGISFDKIKTASSATFTKTKFKNCAPEFYDADLHSSIIWDRDVNLWPHSPKREENESYRDYKERITNNQTIYENLASHMKKLDKYHDEHFFFRQEMRCRRVFENIFVKFPYAVYDAVSDYGYSIGKAFSWWLVHILLGAFFIRINTEKSCNNVCDLADNLLLDLAVSFSNAHGFLPFHNGPLKGCYEHFAKHDIFNTIWGIQTVLGIIFLFMLLLTLRIRFRLK